MRALLAILLSTLWLSVCEAQTTPTCTAPCTQQQLLNDVQTQFPDQTAGGITPAILRQFLNNVIYSMLPTSPLTANSHACYFGTTGLTNVCSVALGLAGGGTGATTQSGAANNIFPPITRTGDIAYWNGTQWVTLAGNNTTPAVLQETGGGVPSWVTNLSGLAFPTPTRAGDVAYYNGTAWVTIPGNNTSTAVLQESSSGVPSWASNLASLAFPTPTRAGDVAYYNGSAWVTIPGNNSGTNFLSENATGIPAWGQPTIPPAVTSVGCGTGLSGGVITSTGTCAVSLTSVVNSLGADVSLTNTANYFDGPSVAQGVSGTWFASGTVTLNDTAAATFYCKLWDGTTVISSAAAQITAAATTKISLSGVLATPAGNIRISCKDITATTGKIAFNTTGNSKDSTVTAMRIQ
jgi:hypothetical protein